MKIPRFFERERRLEGKTLYFNKKTLKLFTFLPFETPNVLFLPKMGTVLFYFSSFSIINYS